MYLFTALASVLFLNSLVAHPFSSARGLDDLPPECQINFVALQCRALTSEGILVTAVDAAVDNCNGLISSLAIQQSKLRYLPFNKVLELVRRCNVRSIEISDTSIEDISEPDYTPSDSLEKFALFVAKVDGLHNWSWEKMAGRLTSFMVAESTFVELPPKFLETILSKEDTSVLHASIIDSKLKQLGEESLACEKCTSINLESNLIEILPSNVFGKKPMVLRVLRLLNNKINDLPEGVFSNLVELRSLELGGNPIKTLNPASFDLGSPGISTEIRFEDSHLTCTCDLSFLKKFYLDLFNCLLTSERINLKDYLDDVC